MVLLHPRPNPNPHHHEPHPPSPPAAPCCCRGYLPPPLTPPLTFARATPASPVGEGARRHGGSARVHVVRARRAACGPSREAGGWGRPRDAAAGRQRPARLFAAAPNTPKNLALVVPLPAHSLTTQQQLLGLQLCGLLPSRSRPASRQSRRSRTDTPLHPPVVMPLPGTLSTACVRTCPPHHQPCRDPTRLARPRRHITVAPHQPPGAPLPFPPHLTASRSAGSPNTPLWL